MDDGANITSMDGWSDRCPILKYSLDYTLDKQVQSSMVFHHQMNMPNITIGKAVFLVSVSALTAGQVR